QHAPTTAVSSMASASVQGHSIAVLRGRRGRGRHLLCGPAMLLSPMLRGWCCAPRALRWPTPYARARGRCRNRASLLARHALNTAGSETDAAHRARGPTRGVPRQEHGAFEDADHRGAPHVADAAIEALCSGSLTE